MSAAFYLILAALYVGWMSCFCVALLRGRRLALSVAARQTTATSF